MNIAIIGLGYVGTVSLGCLARDGHHVIGVDIDPNKLDLIRQGVTPVIETGMEQLVRDAVASGRVETTNDIHYAIHQSDVSFVCVGTPSLHNGSQDLSAIQRVAEQIGTALKTSDGFHACIIRSTVAPGTTEHLIRPLLESHAGKGAGKDFGLGFQPEFLREGSSIKDYDNPPYTVVGSDSERTVAMLREVFAHLPCEFIATTISSAEMLKYSCNAFHALKVTFANEMGRIAQAMGADSHEVMALVCKDTRLNISPAYMRPGFAYGGSCLPKDLRALMRLAQDHDVHLPMLAGVAPSNRLHIEHATDMVLRSGKKSIGMIGLSFKSGTDDLRESPLVVLAETFIGKGLTLRIFDPEVNVARLMGANRQYIEESIPHIASLMSSSCEEVIQGAELLVVGLNDKAIIEQVHALATSDQLVLDLVNIPEKEKLAAQYYGVCW